MEPNYENWINISNQLFVVASTNCEETIHFILFWQIFFISNTVLPYTYSISQIDGMAQKKVKWWITEFSLFFPQTSRLILHLLDGVARIILQIFPIKRRDSNPRQKTGTFRRTFQRALPTELQRRDHRVFLYGCDRLQILLPLSNVYCRSVEPWFKTIPTVFES